MGFGDFIADMLGIYNEVSDYYESLGKIQARRDRLIQSVVEEGEGLKQWLEEVRSVDDLRWLATYLKQATGIAKSIKGSLSDDIRKLQKLLHKAKKANYTGAITAIQDTLNSLKRLLANNSKLFNEIDNVLKSYRRIKRSNLINDILRVVLPALVSMTASFTAYRFLNKKLPTGTPAPPRE